MRHRFVVPLSKLQPIINIGGRDRGVAVNRRARLPFKHRIAKRHDGASEKVLPGGVSPKLRRDLIYSGVHAVRRPHWKRAGADAWHIASVTDEDVSGGDKRSLTERSVKCLPGVLSRAIASLSNVADRLMEG